ncbi:MAG TPA: ribokinase [Candidatus Lachnoclostridium stercorigallinarum]|uniref:Ribokinase n=1 Tax=Candidatus Lachnoclostridium stercorigallinarum TaxID=2838634 RepID=A0A9D2GH14_9FIRM|nr:ribokinase [Candidatus Lachnoclostridium stercorigallinarum]
MKVLNYGSLNIDNVYSVDHFVRGGETLSSSKMEIFSGGKGLNQSIALAKSGAEVWHAGAVGEGDGEFLLDMMKDAGVNVSLVSHVEGKTGHAIIQRDGAGQNCILLFGGANQKITKEQVDQAMEHFEEGDFLVLQNEINEIAYIMEKAHEKGMKIVLNPSPMDGKIAGYPLEYVDYFLLNEIEAGDICKTQGEGEELLEKLSAMFPKAKIVLTLGGDGSMYKDGDLVLKQPIYRVPVADTTAAGDTFTGFFIGGLMQGEDAKTALDHAAKAAAIAVSRPGAAPSIPDRSELEKEI